MDNMLIWMLVCAGATIGLLAVFLIASERELRIKRRELETLANNPANSTEGNPPNDPDFGQQPDIHAIRQLKAENKRLHDDLENLNTKLEVSETRVQELDTKVRGFTSLLTENDQLSKRNEELLDQITAWKNQLQGTESREDLEQGQNKALEARCAALESELTGVKTEINESQACLQELQSTKARLEAAESREQEARDRCADLEKQTAQLAEQLAANQERLLRHESLETQLREVEERYQRARSENERFQEEISRWQERLAASSDTKERLEVLRQRLDELNTKQGELADKHGNIREEMLALTQLLVEARQGRDDSAARITTYESTSPQISLPLATEDERPSLELAKKNLERGSYDDALRQLEQLLKDAPENREIKLYQLLASLRLYNVEDYAKQIDSIAEMTDLTDDERPIARDILLARAEDAHRRGRDEEMLRYREWAENVSRSTPFGAGEHDSPSAPDDIYEDSQLPSGEAPPPSDYPDLSPVAVSEASNGKESAESQNGRTRTIIVASVIGLLVVVGVLFSGFFKGPKTTPLPPSVGVDKSGTIRPNESSEVNTPSSIHPSAGKSEAPAVRTAPNNHNSDSQPSGTARSSRGDNAHAGRLASKNTRGNDSSVTGTQEINKQAEPAAARSASSLWDAYEVVRPTQVLREPRVGSTLIANIERGTRVNVVAARDGWFEIRSKYGRPPGFIPREAAVRIQ